MIAGVGNAARRHAVAVGAATGATLVGVSAPTVAEADELADLLGVAAESFGRPSGKAQGVIVAVPVDERGPLASALVRSGVAVLVESPLTATLAESDDLIEASERVGVAACSAEPVLFAPAAVLAVERLRRMAPLRHMSARWHASHPSIGANNPDQVGGPSPWEVASHPVALALAAVNDDQPIAVRCTATPTTSHIELLFESGLIAVIDIDSDAPDADWSFQAASDDGVVRLELAPHARLEIDGEPVPLAGLPLPGAGEGDDSGSVRRATELGHVAQVAGFAGLLDRSGGAVCPAGFGRLVLDVICAAASSAALGGEGVAVPFAGPRDLTPSQLYGAEPARE